MISERRRLRPRKKKTAPARARSAATATGTPIPAFTPVSRPGEGLAVAVNDVAVDLVLPADVDDDVVVADIDIDVVVASVFGIKGNTLTPDASAGCYDRVSGEVVDCFVLPHSTYCAEFGLRNRSCRCYGPMLVSLGITCVIHEDMTNLPRGINVEVS